MSLFVNYIWLFYFFVERDPNNNIPPPVIGGYSPTIIGDEPPDFVRLEEICPQTVCYKSQLYDNLSI